MLELKVKTLTLVLAIDHDARRILLGMKKRGFGAGKWNGFGGKVESGETIEQAALREFTEESGATATNLEKVAVHDFQFENDMSQILRVHVFTAQVSGEPREMEEMRPQWFDFDAVPYDQMWTDDIHWLPLVLAGKKMKASFVFGEGDVVARHTIDIVATI
jgi:8-oxo-dGTP diphosphatase/2-hydroxy-dATP diphosphatase